MRFPRLIRGSLVRGIVALLALSVSLGAWLPARAPAALAERPPLVLGSLFGEQNGLSIVDDAAGASALAWRATTGEGQAIDFAQIPPGGEEAASSVQTVAASASHRLSAPALAISPGGRVVLAWFEQREVFQPWGADVLAVKVRERAADGPWGATRTLWRAPAKPVYGAQNLVVALDDSGDAVVLWTIEREIVANPQPSQLLVATHAAGSTYGAAVTLDRNAAEALPALAVGPGGEVTALWARPWRSAEGTLEDVSWRAGSAPGSGTSLDEIGPSEPHGSGEPFGSLALQTSASGQELAVWSKGQGGSIGRPEAVSVRAAWKPAGGGFEAPQTVTTPGVEAREPSLALSKGGRALVAWSEIAADGSGPLINYAIATEGHFLTLGGPGAATVESEGDLRGERRVSPVWLPGGKLLLTWDTRNVDYADELVPGAPPGAGSAIHGDEGEGGLASPEWPPLIAGDEAVPPVLVWAGRSPSDFSASGVRYVVGANLPAFGGLPTPSASLVGKRDLARAGVTVKIACPQACVATITGAVYGLRPEDEESAAGAAYVRLGPLTSGRGSLPVTGSKLLRLRLTRHASRAFARHSIATIRRPSS